MKNVAILFLLCGAMACSAAPDADANAAGNAADNGSATNVAAADAPARLVGEDGLTTAVTCYGRMYGMARLYRAIQSAPPSGVDPAEMASLVETHELGAANFMAEAHRLGAETGRSEGQVRALLDGAEQEINAEQDRREITDFSRWLDGEDDRCTANGLAQS
jgi:hypothetical protein